MFNTVDVGKKIAQLRKQANMTQVELADKMNVSYQAASNWERGISMPDISKLPDLAEIFGCSIDELLNSEAPMVSHIISGDVKEYISTGNVSSGEVADIAHIIRPSQMDEIIETIIETEHEETMEDIKKIAPIVDAEVTEKLVDNVRGKISLNDISAVVVHLPEDIIDTLIDRLAPDSDFDDLNSIIVHINDDQIMKIIRTVNPETIRFEKLSRMIVHMSNEAVEYVIDRINETDQKIELNDLSHAIVHMSDESILKAIQNIDKKSVTLDRISNIVVHLSDEASGILVDMALENNCTNTLEGLSRIVVHLSEETVDKIIRNMDKSDIQFSQLGMIVVHLSEESIDALVDAALANRSPLSDNVHYTHFSEASNRKILSYIMETGDIEQLKRIAPFI